MLRILCVLFRATLPVIIFLLEPLGPFFALTVRGGNFFSPFALFVIEAVSPALLGLVGHLAPPGVARLLVLGPLFFPMLPMFIGSLTLTSIIILMLCDLLLICFSVFYISLRITCVFIIIYPISCFYDR